MLILMSLVAYAALGSALFYVLWSVEQMIRQTYDVLDLDEEILDCLRRIIDER